MYLLDTDIISNLLRRSPSTNLIARLAAVPQEQQATTSITLGELIYGAYRLGPQAEGLLERLESVLPSNLAVLPFDAMAARVYGMLRAGLERRGAPIGDADTRISAIAMAHACVVVTANVRHFQRVPGLDVQNWLEA